MESRWYISIILDNKSNVITNELMETYKNLLKIFN